MGKHKNLFVVVVTMQDMTNRVLRIYGPFDDYGVARKCAIRCSNDVEYAQIKDLLAP